ncbi:hypothetical protein [Fluviicola sp.]|jgi:tetratricopeptide (TPR) repeat protein|uniref:hypothetical protein n=1 Tax=Fluviicola sp. TaxID=1917219 RepID=UPI00283867AB|nr:hypothetical protein [Fluviicola sp.]MDR0802798.1 hypothetical protein [Fluviicola sp.]
MRVKLLILISFFFLTNWVIGQSDVVFSVRTINYTTRKKEAGVAVKLMEGSTAVASSVTDAAGEVKFSLKAGKKYKVELSKSGKVPRNFTINVSGIDDELLQGSSKPYGEAEIALFDQQPNVDYSYVQNNPITEFYFDGQNTLLQYDAVLADKMAKKIEKIMKDAETSQKQGEADYNSIIKQADALFTAKKYEEALAQYDAALKIKPTEKHPNDRMIEIDGILKAAKSANLANAQQDGEYKALITAADGLRDQKKYPEAIARYQEALAKKQEQYPKDEIAKCEQAIEIAKRDAENAAKYDVAIKAADGFYNQKSWMAARDKYKEALKLKPNDPVATNKLADLEGKLNAQKSEQEKKQKYNDAVAEGDALMGEEKWADAKAKYTEALTFEASATYPKEKIKEADAKLAEIAKANALKEQITKLLTEGNTAIGEKQYPVAKAKFEQVLTLDAENAEAKTKIQDISKLLEQEKANADKIAKAKQLVTEGDALDKATKYEDAKAKYQESVALIPDVAVQAKIDAIDAKILAEGKKAEQKAKFDQAIADGDEAMAASNFEAAKKKYEEAQLLDAVSAVPKQKLIEVEKKIAQANAEKDKNQKYQEAFNAGISALAAKEYATAKEKLQAALAIDNTKTEAKEKLAEVEKMIADNTQLAAQKEKYDAAVKAGNDLLGQNKLTDAKKKFEEAALLDPAQSLPKEKLKDIDALIAASDKEKQVAQLLSEGAAALGKKDLPGAKGKYQQVLSLDPSNATASEKISEIAKLENDQANEAQKIAAFEKLKGEGMALQNQSKYAEAKQKYLEAKAIKTDEEVEKAIALCDKKIEEDLKNADLDKKYDATLAEAKGLEAAKKYDEAIARYNDALAIRNEQEPKNRINAIKTLKESEAGQQKIEKEYLEALQKGDDLVAEKKYTDAIQAYNVALVLKPDEKLPVEKAKLAKSLAEKETSDGDMAYQKIIDVGNKAFEEKNYTKAKEMFNRAANFRPADQYPKQKLSQIDEIEKVEKQAQEQQNQFVKKMGEADALVKAGKPEEAITAYKVAKAIKPDDQTPDQKIAELQTLLANKVDPEKEAKMHYDQAMLNGNNAAASKDYNEAISYYEEALKHQPKDQSALNKIDEMHQILDNIAKENAANKELTSLIAAADQEFNNGKWPEAKSIYGNILSKYPSNNYAYEQSKKCEIKLKEAADADKERVYRNLVNSANEKFNTADYKKAKELYERAVTQRPTDPYPKQKLKDIDNILNPPVAQKNADSEPGSDYVELKNLGEETDNSLTEGAKKLEEASRKRKGNISQKMYEKSVKISDKSAELNDKQNNLALSADSTFSKIKIENSGRDAAASAKVQNNVSAMDSKNEAVIRSNEENATIKELNIANQKEQLEAARQAMIVTNNTLDGQAADNNEVIKASKNNLGEANTKMDADKYSRIAQNDKTYSDMRLAQEKNVIDDTDQRLAEEKKVREAEINQARINGENTTKSNERTVETREVLKQVGNNIAVKTVEEKKLSNSNDAALKEIDKAKYEKNVEKSTAQVDNAQRFAARNGETEKIVMGAVSSRMDENRENTTLIENMRDQKTELDRADYNKAYLKNIGNKQILAEKSKEIEDKENLPSIAVAENKKNLNEIQLNAAQIENEKVTQNSGKIAGNEQKIRNVQLQNQNSPQNTQATDNATLIKNSKQEMGTTNQIQQDKMTDKVQATKKTIDDAAKIQPEKVSTGSYDVDLSKYKEGVNQEQFDQLGSDGLVSAVVTRRVVVKNGKADVYIRTQTTDAITYTKNGQGCTEYTWQKETQDAKLKRNY